MTTQPTGTVTLLFSDIERSTRLLEALGRERYAETLARHRQILRGALDAHNGHEVDYEGDAFFFAFRSAADAVGAAVDAQRELASEEWPGGHPVRVRMGLHTGEPMLQAPKYVGLDVHRAARIMAAGHGGQVLLSARTASLIEDELPQDLSLVDLGEHQLKDLSRPQHLYQLQIADLPAEFPALRTEGGAVPASSVASVWGRSLGAPRSSRRLLIAIGAALLGIAVLAGGTTFALRSANEPRSERPTPKSAAGQSPAEATTAVDSSSEESTPPISLPRRNLRAIASNSIGMIDPKRSRIVGQIPLGSSPASLIANDHSVWAALENKAVARINPRSQRIAAVIATANAPYQLAFDHNAVWALGGEGGQVSRLSRIELAFNDILLTARVEVGSSRFGGRRARPGIAVGAGSIWVTDPYPPGVVKRIDPSTGMTIGELLVSDDPLGIGPGIAVADGSLWVSVGSATVVRADPRTGSILNRIAIPAPAPTPEVNNRGGPIQLAADDNGLWVITQPSVRCCPTKAVGTGTLSRIDFATNAISATVPLEGFPVSLAVGGQAVWVASQSGTVWRVNPRSLRIESKIDLGGPVAGIASGAGVLWAARQD